MAVNEFTGAASKKVSANTNWSLGHKPTAAEDAVFQEGKEPEFNVVMVCRSLLVRKNVKMTGAAGPEIGNSEKPEGPAGAGVILAEESGVIWPNNLIVKLISTYAGGELPINLGSSWLGKESGTLQLLGSATYNLGEDAKIDATLTIGGGAATPTLKTNNHEVTVANKVSLPSFSGNIVFTGGTLTLGSSVVNLGEWYSDAGAGIAVNAGTSTIIIADGVRGFFEGTRTYSNLTFEGGRPQLRANFTLEGALAFNRTNGFLGIGFTLFAKPLGGSEENESIGNGKYTVTLKKGASVKTNGTAENPAEVVGTSEGERSQLVLEEDIEVKGVLNWKYIEAVGHKIYAPEAQSITGCVNIVKEAKAGGPTAIEGTARVRVGQAGAVTKVSSIASTSKARLAQAATPVPVASAGATAKARLQGTGTPSTVTSLNPVAQQRIRASTSPTAASAIAGSTKVRVADSGAVTPAQSAAGLSKVRVAGTAKSAIVSALAGIAKARFTGTVDVREVTEFILRLAGRVNPSSRSGRVTPSSRSGRSQPRSAHLIPALVPRKGLYPHIGLYPKGAATIEPD